MDSRKKTGSPVPIGSDQYGISSLSFLESPHEICTPEALAVLLICNGHTPPDTLPQLENVVINDNIRMWSRRFRVEYVEELDDYLVYSNTASVRLVVPNFDDVLRNNVIEAMFARMFGVIASPPPSRTCSECGGLDPNCSSAVAGIDTTQHLQEFFDFLACHPCRLEKLVRTTWVLVAPWFTKEALAKFEQSVRQFYVGVSSKQIKSFWWQVMFGLRRELMPVGKRIEQGRLRGLIDRQAVDAGASRVPRVPVETEVNMETTQVGEAMEANECEENIIEENVPEAEAERVEEIENVVENNSDEEIVSEPSDTEVRRSKRTPKFRRYVDFGAGVSFRPGESPEKYGSRLRIDDMASPYSFRRGLSGCGASTSSEAGTSIKQSSTSLGACPSPVLDSDVTDEIAEGPRRSARDRKIRRIIDRRAGLSFRPGECPPEYQRLLKIGAASQPGNDDEASCSSQRPHVADEGSMRPTDADLRVGTVEDKSSARDKKRCTSSSTDIEQGTDCVRRSSRERKIRRVICRKEGISFRPGACPPEFEELLKRKQAPKSPPKTVDAADTSEGPRRSSRDKRIRRVIDERAGISYRPGECPPGYEKELKKTASTSDDQKGSGGARQIDQIPKGSHHSNGKAKTKAAPKKEVCTASAQGSSSCRSDDGNGMPSCRETADASVAKKLSRQKKNKGGKPGPLAPLPGNASSDAAQTREEEEGRGLLSKLPALLQTNVLSYLRPSEALSRVSVANRSYHRIVTTLNELWYWYWKTGYFRKKNGRKKVLKKFHLYRCLNEHGTFDYPWLDIVRSHVTIGVLCCPFCDVRFTVMRKFEAHLLCEHFDEKPFPCNFCDASFASADVYSKHLRKSCPSLAWRRADTGVCTKTNSSGRKK